MKYDHKAIEPKWQEKWEESGVFHAENGSDKPKYYALIEFPYPSGPVSYTHLSFTDDSDVLTSGIEIKVHPPGKIVTHIESLSGGEKALVAISIYFAIMRVNPPPFCVLDEIEAALDDVNVARFAQYLRRMSRQSQFITITHRRGTMEGSDMLYGVTMQDQGISKLLALRTEEAAEFGT